MIDQFETMKGKKILATDGELGSIKDILIDDISWSIRNFVVDLHSNLPDSNVLISPQAVVALDTSERRSIHINLNKAEIHAAPKADLHLPVSRQYESLLHHHFDWQPYWQIPLMASYPYPASVVPATSPVRSEFPEEWEHVRSMRSEQFQGHLKSLEELRGYRLETPDDSFGIVEDFLMEDREMKVIDIVLRSEKYLPGGAQKVCSPFFVTDIDALDGVVRLSIPKETLLESPDFNRDQLDRHFHETWLRQILMHPEAPNSSTQSRKIG